ncbi:phage portal protein [Geomonas nitrogeniifigens]|uniref:phage portal protein n=1 Tax=Geomonas diazotrophica TaxID=2843197 RepID=UPI001C2C2D09|nr:phage portal protein [Geomonas nitrogeniifigens]QXE85982.1 phage portal protein [Geomonas nitrogeniifigens]
MAWLSGAKESRSASPVYSPKDPALADLWGGGRQSASGQVVNSSTALTVSTVWACVTMHAQILAMLPKRVVKLREDGGKDVLATHRLDKLLRRKPNRWQTSFEFFEYMQACRWMKGNAYAQIVFNPGRQQNELVPLDPSRMWPFVKTQEGTIYYLYDNSPPPPPGSVLFYQYFPLNAQSVVLTAEEVLHVRGFSMNGIVGIDPISRAMYNAIGLAMATEEHGSTLFRNGAQIAKVLTAPGKLAQVTYDRMKEQVSGNFAGSANAHKTMILEEGMKVENLSMTSEQVQFLETRKLSVEELARFYNMPLVLIGHGDKAPTYASAEQFFMSFKAHTVQPEVERWEEAMECALLYPGEVDIEIDMDMDSMMRADAKSRSEYLKNRFGTASITPNGIRVYEGENPVTEEGADSLYIMSNMVPLDKAGQNPTKTPAEPSATGEDANA